MSEPKPTYIRTDADTPEHNRLVYGLMVVLCLGLLAGAVVTLIRVAIT